MYPRVNYEMTEDDLKELMEACKPVPAIMLQCGSPPSQQENANNAWKKLGEKMGFDSMTVQPSQKGDRFFSAVPSETEEQRTERMSRENEEKRLTGIKILKKEILERQTELKELEEAK